MICEFLAGDSVIVRKKVEHMFTTEKLEELAREFNNAAQLIRAFEKEVEENSRG
ncbi:hypothetical protein FHX14_000007 [Rhizobium sp. BK619]|uniref:hypothetical protein n=1 Tax=Rhizobium sp. BK619 TaxID=2586989 RepID=UPI00161A7076|nr:hypothetical protein [Rhizobium sp. BK619]MBB3643848.1 hypothetical protein [Rhizobium sp. BK619]